MEITSVNLQHVLVQVGSDYVIFDDDERTFFCHVLRIVMDGGILTAECRLWKPHMLYWEEGNFKGKEPHPKAVVLQKRVVAIPLEDFVDVVDIVHASVFRKIPEELTQNTFFFTHLEDDHQQPRRRGANRFSSLPNLATVRREVGMAIRSHVGRHLRKRGHRNLPIRISFRFAREQVIQVLQEHFQVSTRGKTKVFRLSNPADLDALCGPAWDYHRFGDGFWNCVVKLNLRVCNTEFFTVQLRISHKRPFNGNYREVTSPLFQS